MSELTIEERLLNGFLRIILDSEMNARERQAAAESLRSGKIVNCLLSVLDFSDESKVETRSNLESKAQNIPAVERKPKVSLVKTQSANDVFNLVRKRKISKASLLEMINRLNGGVMSGIDEYNSIREILIAFKSFASDAEWVTLTRAINGEIVNDSYLTRMLGQ